MPPVNRERLPKYEEVVSTPRPVQNLTGNIESSIDQATVKGAGLGNLSSSSIGPIKNSTGVRGSIGANTALGHGIPVVSLPPSSIGDGGVRTTSVPHAGTVIFNEDSPYYFFGNMSEVVLHRYLDRSLQVQTLSAKYQDDESGGPQYGPVYDPYASATSSSPLLDAHYAHRQVLDMIIDTGAKVIFDTVMYYKDNDISLGGITWFLEDQYYPWICATFKRDVEYLHGIDAEIIVGASLVENYPKMNLSVPLITDRSMIDTIYGHFGETRSLDPAVIRQDGMDYHKILVDWSAMTGEFQAYVSKVDYNKPEGMLWYYTLATNYILLGAELIHFGDLFQVAESDANNKNLAFLVDLIRQFGTLHARRRVVLICTHASNDPHDAHASNYLYAWYSEDSSVPVWQRRLIFDFTALGTYYKENKAKACTDTPYDPPSQPVWGNSILPVVLKYGDGLLNHSGGGLHPLGWYCSHSPNLVRLDSGGNGDNAGCAYSDDKTYRDIDISSYGYDNIAWYARQSLDQRKAILKYFFYKIKCVDPYSHFAMPGRLLARQYSNSGNANSHTGVKNPYGYNCFSEADTIRAIWNGEFAGGNDWTPHNFSLENMATESDEFIHSSMITVGDDKIFFIGMDGYIHGYYKNNGEYNDGNWLSCSPSYAASGYHGSSDASQLIANQVAAQSDLVASPDGTRLLYIGVDGYIHGFNILSGWDYTYFTFMKNEMHIDSVKAVGGLIYPTNDRIYYVGNGPSFWEQRRVYGFFKTSPYWITLTPSNYAQSNHGQSLPSQPKVSGKLYYVKGVPHDRIFYIDDDGLVFYYEAINPFDYQNVMCPSTADLMWQELKVISNLAVYNGPTETRLYFAAQWTDGSSYIHCIVYSGSTWHMISPSYNAYWLGVPVTIQMQATGEVAVSPDGNTIVYTNKHTPKISTFKNIDGTYFSYHELNKQMAEYGMDVAMDPHSLQFKNGGEFLLSIQFNYVLRFVFQEAYCNNQHIADYE